MVVLSDPYNNIFYAPIPKNAHSNGQKYFQKLGFKIYYCDNFSDLENKHLIIFLREPIDRWLAGFCQDTYFTNRNYDFEDTQVLDEIFGNLGSGLHTFLQTSFLKYSSNQITYINVDKNLTYNLNIFTKRFLYRPVSYDLRPGSNYDYKMKDKISNIVHNTPKYKNLLEKYLAPDIELYNSVKFYTG